MKPKLIAMVIIACCMSFMAQVNDSLLKIIKKCGTSSKENQIICLYTTYRQTESDELSTLCVNQCKTLVLKQSFEEGKQHVLDSVLGWVYNEIGYEYSFTGKVDSAIWAYTKGLNIRRKNADSIGVANIYVNMGYALQTVSEFDEALKYYKLALPIYLQVKKYNELAGNYNNIASIYNTKGDVRNAIDNLMLSMKYYNKSGNQKGVAWIYNSLGYVYFQQNEKKLSYEWYKKALDLATKLDYKEALALIYNNLGSLEKENNNPAGAIEHHLRALKLRKLMHDIRGEIMSLNNIGSLLMMTKNYMRAELYLNDCKRKCIETNFISGLTKCYINLASLHQTQGRAGKAKVFADSAYYLSKMTDNVDQVLEAADRAYKIERDLGNVNKALFYLEEVVQVRDSLNSKAIQRELYKKQFEYDLDKEQQAFEFQKREKQIELDQQRKVKNVFIVSLICVLALGIYISYSLAQTRKKNRIISKQKEFIEDKQKEILDSITYAKRLQEAIIPTEVFWKKHLPDSFILYKPKDIVAGDFYWMEAVKNDNDTLILFAAADCTGHGVPGALVSVVCSNALNRSVHEFQLTDPGKILDKTKELVISTFEKSGKDVKDGMDISLCALSLSSLTLKWAGANNGLWYVSQNELVELKPNKQPIGKTENSVPFETHSVKLNAGDCIYLFTDGYADQFGNEPGVSDETINAFGKGKKFKYKKLKDLVFSVSQESMDVQKTILNDRFNSWKGILEQVDDVTLIGLKV